MLACGGAQFLLFLSRRKHCEDGWKPLRWPSAWPPASWRAIRSSKPSAVARRVNSEGITITLDHLGESVTSLEEAAAARDVYLEALSAIQEAGIEGNVSLKLTQFGLDFRPMTNAAPTWNNWSGAPPG